VTVSPCGILLRELLCDLELCEGAAACCRGGCAIFTSSASADISKISASRLGTRFQRPWSGCQLSRFPERVGRFARQRAHSGRANDSPAIVPSRPRGRREGRSDAEHSAPALAEKDFRILRCAGARSSGAWSCIGDRLANLAQQVVGGVCVQSRRGDGSTCPAIDVPLQRVSFEV